MKKLMFIAIATISLLFVSNAFGQERRASSKTKIVKGIPWVIAADHGLSVKNGKSRGTSSNQRSSRTRKPPTASVEEMKLTVKKPRVKSLVSNENLDERRKQPRKRSTQKRQYKPLQF